MSGYLASVSRPDRGLWKREYKEVLIFNPIIYKLALSIYGRRLLSRTGWVSLAATNCGVRPMAAVAMLSLQQQWELKMHLASILLTSLLLVRSAAVAQQHHRHDHRLHRSSAPRGEHHSGRDRHQRDTDVAVERRRCLRGPTAQDRHMRNLGRVSRLQEVRAFWSRAGQVVRAHRLRDSAGRGRCAGLRHCGP